MKRTNRYKVRVCLLLLVLLLPPLFAGCTAQNTPLDERAVVRLIYLEKTGEEYRALTVVCDFSGGTDPSQAQEAAVVQTAQAAAAEQALQQAAAQRGGEPFFAQNRLLLVGPQLASTELPAVLEHFAASCGAYRDPSLWLWYGGEDGLQRLQDPMTFVRMAEALTQKDELGCVVHVLECADAENVVLPVLEQGANNSVQVGGLAAAAQQELRLFRQEEILQGYGLLRGSRGEQLLTTEHDGVRYTLRLLDLQRDLTQKNGRLQLIVSGAVNAAGDDSTRIPDAVLRAAEEQVYTQCTQAWRALTQNGRRDIFSLRWWGKQLGASAGAYAEPEVVVRFHAE